MAQAAQVLGGRYRLIEPLGAGGMSVVWRAHDEVLGRPVAVKLLASRFAADAEFRDRIRAEAQAAARVTHPHITTVFDYGESTGADGVPLPFVVMELINGHTLAAELAAGPLPWHRAVETGAEVAAALSAAHAQGLVHRDVTPGNVMLTPSGVKVVDFGISAVIGERGAERHVIGTPAFMAPERLTGAIPGPAVDVYALGVLMRLALTGAAGFPADVTALCEQCVDPDPARRPTSAEAARRLAAAAGIRVPVVEAGGTTAARLSEVHTPVGTRIMPPADLETEVQWVPRGRGPVLWLAVAGTIAATVLLAVIAAAAPRHGPPTTPSGSTAAEAAAPSATKAAPLKAGCEVAIAIHRWDDGATVDLTLTNRGADVSGWTLTFTLEGNQRVVQSWNGRWDQDDDRVTVRDAGYNAQLASGATLSLGANLETRGKRRPAPSDFALNGTTCAVTATTEDDDG